MKNTSTLYFPSNFLRDDQFENVEDTIFFLCIMLNDKVCTLLYSKVTVYTLKITKL